MNHLQIIKKLYESHLQNWVTVAVLNTLRFNMYFIQGLYIALSAIWTNKIRSLLTMLGIIIGIAAVLAMIAIGDGAKEIVRQDVQKLGGANQFWILYTGYKWKGNRRTKIRSDEYLEFEDVLAIQSECSAVNAVTPRIGNWAGVLIQSVDGVGTRAGWNGVDSTYTKAMNWDIKEGRFITDEDVAYATKVCVLGDEVATELFGEKSALGQEVKISRHSDYYKKKGTRLTERFRVIGTLKPRGRSLRFGWSFDNLAFIPITTVQERFTGSNRLQEIVVYAHSVEQVPKAIEQVKSVIRKRHRNQDDFIRIFEMHRGMAQLEKISQVIKISLGSIAGFSLLVGGIGIMNMMLVAVGERTQEIGLRKAVGAKNLNILIQFLMEAVVMCGVGGVLGIGIGILTAEGLTLLAIKIVKIVPDWPAVLSINWVLISMTFSTVIGIVFGIYPAIKASVLTPIEALRTE